MLKQKDPVRLKPERAIQEKDGGKDHGHGKNSSKDIMGKNYMAWKKEKKRKKKKKNDDNKQR